jgi:hypothetical protein
LLQKASLFKARDVPDFNKIRRAQSCTPRRKATLMVSAPALASEVRHSQRLAFKEQLSKKEEEIEV